MHLARGLLNLVSRDVTRDLADPLALHRTVLRAFPDGLGDSPRARVRVLFRVDIGRDGGALLVVQSGLKPDFAKLPQNYFVDPADDRLFSLGWTSHPLVQPIVRPSMEVGRRFFFRLRANVTKKIGTKSEADGKRRNGTRVPLRGDALRMAWLSQRAAGAGFRILDARVVEEAATRGRRTNTVVTLAAARFDGLLEVTEPERFAHALDHGVGPAKAFGFGLLSVLPAP
jgi:CRISPR system Cascade subunit CasE